MKNFACIKKFNHNELTDKNFLVTAFHLEPYNGNKSKKSKFLIIKYELTDRDIL